LFTDGVCVGQDAWVEMTAPASSGCGSVQSSSTGQILLASCNSVAYMSYDYGESWTAVLAPDSLSALTMSSNGQYVYVTTNTGQCGEYEKYCYVYISKDYGSTWSTSSTLNYVPFNAVGCDPTGQYVFVGTGGLYAAYYSTDYAESFSVPSYGNEFDTEITTISSSGKVVFAGNYAAGSTGMHKSVNYGATFHYVSVYSGTSNDDTQWENTYSYLSCSANSTICCTVGSYTGKIYHFDNSTAPNFYASSPADQLFSKLTVSESGQYVMATSCDNNDYTNLFPVYLSHDKGANFYASTSPKDSCFGGITSNAAGTSVIVIASTGTWYKGTVTYETSSDHAGLSGGDIAAVAVSVVFVVVAAVCYGIYVWRTRQTNSEKSASPIRTQSSTTVSGPHSEGLQEPFAGSQDYLNEVNLDATLNEPTSKKLDITTETISPIMMNRSINPESELDVMEG
jgi:hypothetical protein